MSHECQEKLELCTVKSEVDVLNLTQNIVDFKIVTVFQEKTHQYERNEFLCSQQNSYTVDPIITQSALSYIKGQFSSVTQLCLTLRPHGLQHIRLPCSSLSLLKLMSIELVMPSNHLILCHSLLLLPSIFLSIYYIIY